MTLAFRFIATHERSICGIEHDIPVKAGIQCLFKASRDLDAGSSPAWRESFEFSSSYQVHVNAVRYACNVPKRSMDVRGEKERENRYKMGNSGFMKDYYGMGWYSWDVLKGFAFMQCFVNIWLFTMSAFVNPQSDRMMMWCIGAHWLDRMMNCEIEVWMREKMLKSLISPFHYPLYWWWREANDRSISSRIWPENPFWFEMFDV